MTLLHLLRELLDLAWLPAGLAAAALAVTLLVGLSRARAARGALGSPVETLVPKQPICVRGRIDFATAPAVLATVFPSGAGREPHLRAKTQSSGDPQVCGPYGTIVLDGPVQVLIGSREDPAGGGSRRRSLRRGDRVRVLGVVEPAPPPTTRGYRDEGLPFFRMRPVPDEQWLANPIRIASERSPIRGGRWALLLGAVFAASSVSRATAHRASDPASAASDSACATARTLERQGQLVRARAYVPACGDDRVTADVAFETGDFELASRAFHAVRTRAAPTMPTTLSEIETQLLAGHDDRAVAAIDAGIRTTASELTRDALVCLRATLDPSGSSPAPPLVSKECQLLRASRPGADVVAELRDYPIHDESGYVPWSPGLDSTKRLRYIARLLLGVAGGGSLPAATDLPARVALHDPAAWLRLRPTGVERQACRSAPLDSRGRLQVERAALGYCADVAYFQAFLGLDGDWFEPEESRLIDDVRAGGRDPAIEEFQDDLANRDALTLAAAAHARAGDAELTRAMAEVLAHDLRTPDRLAPIWLASQSPAAWLGEVASLQDKNVPIPSDPDPQWEPHERELLVAAAAGSGERLLEQLRAYPSSEGHVLALVVPHLKSGTAGVAQWVATEFPPPCAACGLDALVAHVGEHRAAARAVGDRSLDEDLGKIAVLLATPMLDPHEVVRIAVLESLQWR